MLNKDILEIALMVFNFHEKPLRISFSDVQIKEQLLRVKSIISIIFCDF